MPTAPEGYEVEWYEPDDARLATREERETRKCRRPKCPNTPAWALKRHRYRRGGSTSHWWLYCADHTYGRRILSSRVLMYRWKPATASAGSPVSPPP